MAPGSGLDVELVFLLSLSDCLLLEDLVERLAGMTDSQIALKVA